MEHHPKKLDGLTKRASYVISTRGVHVGYRPLNRQAWLDGGVPEDVFQRAVAFQQRWGGLALPPPPEYDGGPVIFDAGVPETGPGGEWYFEAGRVRAAVPYGFVVGPHGEFAIETHEWTALHVTVDGWVESVALAHYAAWAAHRTTRMRGTEVDELDLDGFEPVPAVQGMADTWWQGPNRLIAIYRGEAEHFGNPALTVARIYDGVTLRG